MTNRYANGKIYKLVSNKTNKIYIGSCCVPLRQRLYEHKKKFKSFVKNGKSSTTSKELFKLDDKIEIILIEDYPCQSKNELERRERFYIENMICVNKRLPARSRDERVEYEKRYQANHKDEIAENKKQYYSDHKEEIAEYQADHKDEIAERKKQPMTCACGSTFRKSDKSKHERTKKHQTYLSTIPKCILVYIE
jgi:hypothetical protein